MGTSSGREGKPLLNSSSMTASDVVTALRLARELEDAQMTSRERSINMDARRRARLRAEETATELEENVTPLNLATARFGKKE